nr:MAG TPA: LydA holin phage, holin superfamily III [Siphoviridae sp. ct2u94]
MSSIPKQDKSPYQGVGMRRMPYKSDPGLFAAMIALGMTVLGSIAAYAYKVLSGDAFSWRTLCLQMIVSVFAGFLMMLLAIYWQWPQEVTGAICGMAGWSGSSLIKTLEKRFLQKASGDSGVAE